jgi:hypothetical protein
MGTCWCGDPRYYDKELTLAKRIENEVSPPEQTQGTIVYVMAR